MAISSSKDFIVFPNDNSGRIYVNETSFTASGTWTAPAGVTSAQVILVGAGGGGGGGSAAVAAGGGGAGAVVVKNINVTPLTTYSVSIGAGGQGGLGSQNSATDLISTLPGGNGTATTFGNITVANMLTNPDFDYNVLAWDTAVVFRNATGVASASSITVFPNANGIVAGMYVSGTNLGTNAQVQTVTGNVVSLSVANAASAVQTVVRFDNGEVTLRPSNIFFNNISAGSILSNPQTQNTPASPYFQNLSNNLLMPETSQLEEAAVLTNNYVRQFGTALSTFSITNAGVPTKLAEMTAGYSKLGTGTLSTYTLTLDNTVNVFPGMYISGTGIAAGTVVLSVDSTTQVTLSATLTQSISASAVVVSYTATSGINGLLVGTGSSTSTGAPTWVSWSSLNTTAYTTGGGFTATSSTGYQGVPYIPGQTYTVSAYVSANQNVSTSTPIAFQIRSTGATYGAQSNLSYLNGTNSGTTGSIDANQPNGFFVRQATPAALTNYGGAFATTGTASNGATSVTVADATGILIGMAVTGSGIQSNTVVSTVAGTVIGISLATQAPLSNTALTFANPAGAQILGSNITVGQTGWRRISASFTTPSIATVGTNGVYAWGSTPQFIYPVVVFQQPSTNFWIDNVQLEVGNAATTWEPPVYREAQSLLMFSAATTGGNLETAHRFVKATAGTVYSGSAFVVAGGTSNQYRPLRAFVEFFDKDYNSLTRVEGANNYYPISGVAVSTAQMPNVSYPVRVGVTATSPTGTAYARFGVVNYQGAQTGSAGQVEFNIFAPQLEVAAIPTTYKKVDNTTYFYAGQAGASPVITAATVSAEGGGGGGTYNSNSVVWQYGLEGANNGGHAANNSYQSFTAGGGGAGSTTAGFNAVSPMTALSNTTTSNVAAGYNTTAGSSHPTFPMRGNYGGAAVWNTGTNTNYLPGFAGDGGYGTVLSSLNSGSPLGIAIAGGGGGAGWSTNAQNQTFPGRGNAGGGKGGGTYLVQLSGTTADYYARGLDAIANTGSGGGGGGSNQNQDPATPIDHNAAKVAVNYEAISSEYYKWEPVYNATTTIVGGSIMYGTNSLRATMQDVGNAKLQTTWQSFAILPRIPLYFPGVAARLTTAPAGVTSPQFPGLPKRVRPTVRWKDINNVLIREDRPAYDIIFAGTNTVTYLGPTGSTAGSWQTLLAPVNAAFFDVTWELLYMDAGDVIDLDFGGCQYYGYWSQGGNGADGYAIVRWFDKAVL
jgi:hypothetical protein